MKCRKALSNVLRSCAQGVNHNLQMILGVFPQNPPIRKTFPFSSVFLK